MYKLKINGVLEISEPLEKEKDYSIALKRVAVKDTVTRENESGTTTTYIMENQDIVTLIAEDKAIIAKPTKYSQSQMLRFVIRENWNNQHAGYTDEEEYYRRRLNKIIEDEKNLYN